MAVSAPKKYIGARMNRVEDPRILMGQGKYVDDISLPGMLEIAFLRSPHGHARIKSINIEKAKQHPDCVAIFTAKDFEEGATVFIPYLKGELKAVRTPFFAKDKVRYVGEIIAAVVSDSRYHAEDIADLIEVDYEILPAVVNVEEGMKPDAPLLHEDIGTNVYYTDTWNRGDVEKAFREADLIVKEKVETARTSAAPMETRGVVANWDWDDKLTVWSSTQMPYFLRTNIAAEIGIPEQKLRVIAPNVGGGFGQKAHFFPEEFILPFITKQLKKPVKWTEDRREHLLTAAHAKQQTNYMEIALKKDGTILGIKNKSIGDSGAYALFPWTGLIEPLVGNTGIPGAFRVENVSYETAVVLTNKSPVGAYRGVGWSNVCYARDVVLAKAAKLLGLDIVDIYRKNFITKDQFPYTTATDQIYDSGDYHAVLEKAVQISGYEDFKKQPRITKDGKLRGLGLGFFVEPTAWGSRVAAKSGFPVTYHDTATIEIDPTGKVTVRSGQFSHGQGHKTSLAQVAADTLGVPFEDVTVLDGDTDTGAYGMGTYASRSAVIGGGTVMRAARDLREKLLKIAAHVMEANVADLTIEEGNVFVKGSPERSMTVKELSFISHFDRFRRPDENELEPVLVATRHYDPPETYANGAHAIEIELDPKTGMVDIKRIVAVEDCGTIINPKIVEGQMRGGIAQAIGMGFLESLDYDENGQLRNASFMDFLLPTAQTLPDIECHHIITPSPYTEGGIKGCGEAAMLSIHSALATAVADALSEQGILVPMVTPLGPQQITDLMNNKGHYPHSQQLTK
jgi:carbon-monoxide dehydrogenase large subunit